MAHVEKREGRKKPFLVGWRDPVTKRMRWKSFAKKGDADAFKDQLNVEVRQGTYIDPRPMPFKTFALDWLARTEPTVEPNTHALHEWAVYGYLIPAFGMTPIQHLGAVRIERWQANLLKGIVEGRTTDGPETEEEA